MCLQLQYVVVFCANEGFLLYIASRACVWSAKQFKHLINKAFNAWASSLASYVTALLLVIEAVYIKIPSKWSFPWEVLDALCGQFWTAIAGSCSCTRDGDIVHIVKVGLSYTKWNHPKGYSVVVDLHVAMGYELTLWLFSWRFRRSALDVPSVQYIHCGVLEFDSIIGSFLWVRQLSSLDRGDWDPIQYLSDAAIRWWTIRCLEG